MKRKFKIIPRWDPEQRFTLPFHHDAPVARRLPEFLPGDFPFPEEIWRNWTLLR